MHARRCSPPRAHHFPQLWSTRCLELVAHPGSEPAKGSTAINSEPGLAQSLPVALTAGCHYGNPQWTLLVPNIHKKVYYSVYDTLAPPTACEHVFLRENLESSPAMWSQGTKWIKAGMLERGIWTFKKRQGLIKMTLLCSWIVFGFDAW